MLWNAVSLIIWFLLIVEIVHRGRTIINSPNPTSPISPFSRYFNSQTDQTKQWCHLIQCQNINGTHFFHDNLIFCFTSHTFPNPHNPLLHSPPSRHPENNNFKCKINVQLHCHLPQLNFHSITMTMMMNKMLFE